MKPPFKDPLLFMVITIALIISALGVTPVFADDETPPPSATEQPVQLPTDEPIATPAPSVAIEESLANPVEETTVVEQIMEELPTDTSVVVLDTSGQAIPLATQVAAIAFVSGDPIWCPAGVLPGNPACTNAQASLNDLIAVLQTRTDGSQFDYSGAGTIYIAWDYDPNNPAATIPDVGTSIDFNYNQLGLTDLTIQGGWDFGSNVLTPHPSTISGVYGLYFGDWGRTSITASSLTLNDLIIDGGELYIGSFGGSVNANVELNDVSVVNSDGTRVETDKGNITVDSGTFSANRASGLIASSANGNITLNDVIANQNSGWGALLVASGVVNVTNSRFDSNVFDGLYSYAGGNMNLQNVTASNNADDGSYLTSPGNALVACSKFNSNGGFGINAMNLNGSLDLDSVTFDGLNGPGEYFYGDSPAINTIDCNPSTPTETPVPPTGTPAPPTSGTNVDGQQEQQTINRMADPLYFIFAQAENQLPAVLGQGKSFTSALKVVLTSRGEQTRNLKIMLAFPIPEGVKATKLAVMLWNGAQWVNMPGGNLVNGYFVLPVPGPGVYVLITE